MTSQQQIDNDASPTNEVDISLLADEVYRLLLQELRIERERQRFTSRRLVRNWRSS